MELTKKIVEKLPFPKTGQQFIWDDDLTGFGLRLTPTKKTYIVQGRVRVQGKRQERRVSLGEHGIITLQEARRKAQKKLSAMLEGKDPIAEKKRDTAYALTLRDIADKYLEARRELKESSKADIEKHLNKSFSDWANRPAVEINRDKVAKRFTELTEKSPAQANQAFRILRALLNFARGEYHHDGHSIIIENPVSVLSDTKRWNTVGARSGRIPTNKIGAAWNALQSLREAPEQTTISRTLADGVSFLLLTGARWSEMANLTWDHVNLDDPSWSIPDPKNRNPVTFPLSRVACKILSARPKEEKYVFPSRIAEKKRDTAYALTLRDIADKYLEARRELKESSKADIEKHLNKSFSDWAKAEKKDAELQNIIAEQKIRTQRILGKLIKEGQNKGEIAGKGNVTGNNQYGNVQRDNISSPKTLSDIGLTRKQSSRINDGHIKDARSVMETVSAAGGVRVSPHDLRRTFRAIAGECGIELYKTKLLMNHKLSGDITIHHYTETNDLRYLSNEINLISDWIIRQGTIAASDNILEFKAG